MDYIFIGKIVNTHGIKGEVRLISDFEHKDKVFLKNFKIYIGDNKEEVIVETYRVHKSFDMLTFENINNINEVLKYKGKNAYINKDDIDVDYFLTDLVGMNIYTDKKVGTVTEIITNGKQEIFKCQGKGSFLIPNVSAFIKKIDLENKIIYINEIPGLINEN